MNNSMKLLSISQLIRVAGLPGYLLLFNNILLFFIKRRRAIHDYINIDTSAFIQIIYLCMIFGLAFNALVLKSNIRVRILTIKPNLFLVIYIFICFISALWSENMNLTLYRAFECITFLILISWIVYNLSLRLDIQNMIEWVVFWGIWCIFWSVLTSVKLYGLNYLEYPFYAARLEYPVVIFFALLLSKRKIFKYIILIFTLFSISNKIYLGFAIGLLGFLFGHSKSKGLIFIFSMALIFLITLTDFESLLKSTIFLGREEISIDHASGRSQIWRLAWDSFKERPLLGYSFVSGETIVLHNKFEVVSAHNFIFSGLIGTGISGTFFLLLYFYSSFKIGLNKYWPQSKLKVAVIGTLIMSLTISLTAPGIGGRLYGSWISVVLIISIITAINYKLKNNKKYNMAN